MKITKCLAGFVIVVIIAAVAIVEVRRHDAAVLDQSLHSDVPITTTPTVPIPQNTAPPTTSTPPATTPPATTTPVVTTPATINWAVPFTSQAPTGNWDAFHEQTCEEASSIMVSHYFKNVPIISDQVENELSDVATWERANLGTDVSITAAQVVTMLTDYYGLQATLIKEPTAKMLKAELAQEHLIIVPAQGQYLNNPYFTAPGPVYHMLVLRGYDANDHFITNDPGTKHGEQYVYTTAVLMNAIHDWNDGDVANGAKVVISVSGLKN